MHGIEVLNVFTSIDGGGNPAPIVADANGLSESEMIAIARLYGHESGFICVPDNSLLNDYKFRFFVPRHEMSMCGHATIGAIWLLSKMGALSSNKISIQTMSGTVMAYLHENKSGEQSIEISQPAGTIDEISDAEIRYEIIQAIGLTPDDILNLPFLNASTSRIKTLIPVRNAARLDAAKPDSKRIEILCEKIGSTGLYPFAADADNPRKFDARQFPKSSGYPEDAATGIAATALAFGLLHYRMIGLDSEPVLIHQGRVMGHPSNIFVRFDLPSANSTQAVGCFVGGTVAFARSGCDE